MIPQERVSRRQVDRLLEYLVTEFSRAQSARAELDDNWARWDKLYRTRSMKKDKDFPFRGSADIVVPVIATDVEIIWGQLMGEFFGPPNLWSVLPGMPEALEYAPRVQEFLQWAQENELNAFDVVGDWLLEVVKRGTGVLKTRYNRQTRKVYEFREGPQGIVEAFNTLMLKNHPAIDHVLLHNFWIPPGYPRIQDAPWVGETIELGWAQLIERAQQGVYVGAERLAAWMTSRGSKVEVARQDLEQYRIGFGDKISLREAWLDWDIDDDGQPEALVCTLHPDSRTYLRIDFNPYLAQERPYSAARYMRVEGRFYGVGVCEMLESPQVEITTMHNQRIDNATIANSRVYKVLRTATQLKRDEPLYPGKRLYVDSMEDIAPMPMGDKYDSTERVEATTLGYAQRRTGASDYMGGMNTPDIGYGTATTTVAMLREGKKRLDQVKREVRSALSQVGTWVLELYQQHNQYGKEFQVLGQEDGRVMQMVLQFPLDIIRHSVKIDVTATSAAANKEVEVRTNTILLNALDGYHQQVLQYLGYAVNPGMPAAIRALALAAIQGKSILLRRVFDAYDVQDTKMLIPNLEELLSAGLQEYATYGGPLGRSAGAAGGALLPPGMGGAPAGGAGAPGVLMGGP